jgi:hypothetical protein
MATMTPNPMIATTPQGEQGAGIDPTKLPRELWYPLWQLLMELETQDEIPRRYEVREILKRRLFYRGEQYWFWNEDIGSWLPPNQGPAFLGDEYQEPAFQHVTNIIQSTLNSLASVLSQNNTAARFWPEKPSNPQDIQTAKSASKVVDYIHRNVDWQNLVDQATYFMGTDGFIGSYSRYVSDGERFGHDEHEILAEYETPVGDASVACPACGYEEYGGTSETTPVCPECGEALVDVPPPTVMVPQPVGTIKIPRGQEMVSIVPALQLKRTMYADEQKDFLYLDWITDLHKSIAMATFTEKADEIDASAGGDAAGGGTANTYERIARRILYLGTGRHTGMTLTDLGTFRRAWIRTKALYGIKNKEVRAQLLQLFPDGVKVTFFNDVYCESSNESMDKKWETMHTMPGEGQLRETLISALLPIQEQLNDCINLLFETCMYGVPEGFADMDLLDMEARNEQGAQVGNITPTKQGLGSGGDIRAKLMFTPAVEPSAGMMKFIDMLMGFIRQLLSGDYPALSGGDTGSNDTASGIAIQRNQALGRIGRAWRRLQLFLCNTDAKAVKSFAENRQEDVEIPKESESGDYKSDVIKLEDMQGNIVAYPETDAQYPVLEADVRAITLQMFNNNPVFQQVVVAVPENLETVMRYAGLKGIQTPGEQQRKATNGVIEQLVQQQPQQVTTINAQTGQPETQMLPSIPPDPDADNLQIAGETAKSWLVSDEGIEARVQNQMGWENVKAYSKACSMLQKQQELQQAIAEQGLAGTGPAADLGGADSMEPPPHQEPAPPSEGPGEEKSPVQ